LRVSRGIGYFLPRPQPSTLTRTFGCAAGTRTRSWDWARCGSGQLGHRVQPRDLFLIESSHSSRIQSPDQDRPDPYPDEAQDRVTQRIQHPPHLPFAPLGHHDGHRGAGSAALDEPGSRRSSGSVLELDARGEPANCLPRDLAIHLDQVLLLDPVARMLEAVRQFPVVRQEQQPFAVPVESSHREHPGALRHEFCERSSRVRITHRAGHPARLVQGEVAKRWVSRNGDAVHRDRIRLRVHPVAETRHAPSDPNPARRDQLLSLAAGSVSGPGERLLQPLGRRGWFGARGQSPTAVLSASPFPSSGASGGRFASDGRPRRSRNSLVVP
jgi:hypothetical protein